MSLITPKLTARGLRAAFGSPAPLSRQIHSSTRTLARKDAEDRNSINTDSTEYSKSGGDDTTSRDAASAAFSKDATRPEEELNRAGQQASAQGKNSNPLDVSPANHDASNPKSTTDGGSQGSPSETGQGSDRARSSGKGHTPKSG